MEGRERERGREREGERGREREGGGRGKEGSREKVSLYKPHHTTPLPVPEISLPREETKNSRNPIPQIVVNKVYVHVCRCIPWGTHN